MKATSLFLVLGLGLSLSACATATVQRDMLQNARMGYTAIVVGEFSTNDELWQSYALGAKRGLSAKLVEFKMFAQVVDQPTVSPPTNAVVVTARVTEVDRGSAAARWIIGFGAGRAHITSQVQLAEPSGMVLGNFTVRRAYSGGAGIGGAGFLDMDDLAQLLGEEAANTIVAWAKTGSVPKQ